MKNQVFLPAATRAGKQYGWLSSYHSFDLSTSPDPSRKNLGPLIVLNDDTVAPGMGFREHAHSNMEIISIPLQGTVTHKDSTGQESIITVGDIQVMSAGSGILHSEFNRHSDPAEFLQIWIQPNELNVTPGYQQLSIDKALFNTWQLIAAPDATGTSAIIHQDAWLSVGLYEQGIAGTYKCNRPGNGIYVFVMKGELDIDGDILSAKDAVTITGASEFSLFSRQPSEVLVIEVTLSK